MLRSVTIVVAALLIAVAPSTHAQSSLPQFEVASVKPNTSGSQSWSTDWGPSFKATNVTVRSLILQSYVLFESQLAGGPDWISTARFDIEARADREATPRSNVNARVQYVNAMVQSLLEERFRLRVHREMRELPVFNLVVARGGSKLRPTVDPAASRSGGTRGGPVMVEMTGTASPIADLIRRLAQTVGRPIIDKTNLTRNFDFTLKFSARPLNPVPNDFSTESTGADLSTAIEEQLGLKLESARGPVEVLVIDSVQRPTEN